MSFSLTHFNGRIATAEDLVPLAFSGYAHFTAMQVRDHAVRGLDLHLERLRTASVQLFGQHLPDERVRGHLRAAIEAGPPESSVSCYITARPGEFMPAGPENALDVLIKVTDPAQPPVGPLALEVVPHERHLAHIKHVGEIAKTLYLRRAHAGGFDDAAFQDRSGRLSEATIWNLLFWDGESVIYPEADVLPGVTLQILARQLSAGGVPQQMRPIHQSDLAGSPISAVVMNSWTPGIAVKQLGNHQLEADPTFVRVLHEAYTQEPPVRA